MKYRAKEPQEDRQKLEESVAPVVAGAGFSLVEASVSRTRGSVQVRLTVARPPGDSGIGTDELGRLHRALLPRLELLYGADKLQAEVSSPGIDRQLKEGAEFAHFAGRKAACYLAEKSDWVSGTVRESDGEKVVLENEEGAMVLYYQNIAKAKLL